ncbi:dolichyl-diphosphooligosaccharide--protein glycosyltransferase subunit 1-like [Portunus trituberculatus]|uniref:Dolichyl-diphosphooligosaccharide--protein glycosyltransferase subunit 1 n=1 Tax=Portunus trituberculatus TaxID=210409 RepID=A0A5B7CEA4_PORTR|nr:dolichyl-diphosphooligosaccharide--protein glycosyltransferase subunit 1-like [Portunus trituberculatus]MPC07727.1 Dolichyl-diphosphooligosaccharide--protein glycosyltransferase subunit 1 [Portunus trituberculatus]
MRLLVCLVVAVTGVVAAQDGINKDLINKKIERKLDISSQLVKVTQKITLENGGPAPVRAFLVTLTQAEKDKLSYMNVQSGSSVLKVSEAQVAEHRDLAFFRVDLRDPLQTGKTVNVEVEMIMTQLLEPYPAYIQQGEKQLVRYTGNHYVLTPYTTTTQTTTVTLPSPNIESYSRLKPTTHTDTSITYGSYEGVAGFTVDTMTIHYENNSPFLMVSKLERTIEVSHWGNIAVEETLDVLHTGARLKGPFSRYDYQREHNSYSSIKSFKTIIPASAKDVYYRDEIGNISTSHMRIQDDAVELDLRPRFPLFGGWKTHYKIGYNVPSYEYLYSYGDEYILKMRILDHVFDDVTIDELKLTVILPEGVRNIAFETPYPMERLPDTVHYTYLDTVGRPVVSVTKNNLVESHIQDFTLHYKFPSILMLQEPLLVVIAFFILFLTVILYVRLDLTLSKDDATEAKMRVSSHCEQVHTHHEKRARLYEKLEEEIQKLKSSKDVTHSQTATKKIQGSIRDETQAISELAGKIRLDNAEYAEKVAELQKIDKMLRESVVQQLTNVEKLVAGKMSKQQYMDAETPLHKKKEEALEKIKVLLGNI